MKSEDFLLAISFWSGSDTYFALEGWKVILMCLLEEISETLMSNKHS